jgi:hypothetical protein
MQRQSLLRVLNCTATGAPRHDRSSTLPTRSVRSTVTSRAAARDVLLLDRSEALELGDDRVGARVDEVEV